jgi:hypothetical protein
MGETMNNSKTDKSMLKILEKVQNKLKEMELSCPDYETKEKLLNLIDFIEEETSDSKTIFAEMVYNKVKETRGVSSELNTYFYLLYRNLEQDKVSLEEAQKLYNMYVKEFEYYKAY